MLHIAAKETTGAVCWMLTMPEMRLCRTVPSGYSGLALQGTQCMSLIMTEQQMMI